MCLLTFFVIMASASGEGSGEGELRTRKQGPKPSEWKQNVARERRNLGQEYVSRTSGKVVKKRNVGEPCKDGCFTMVGMDNIRVIHSDFWKLGNHDLQNAYIQKMVKVEKVKRHRVREARGGRGARGGGGEAARVISRRSFTRSYTVSCGDVRFSVCAVAFRNILGVTDKRVRVAVQAVTATGATRPDQRGRHKPAHAMDDTRKGLVVRHIKSFPTVSSHYTRAKSPHMRYMETNMTIQKMYRLYREWLYDLDVTQKPVKLDYYRRVFRGFRIGFKPPSTDTCSKCDRLKVQLDGCQDTITKQRLQDELDDHLRLAREGMAVLSDLAKDDDPDTRCICLDLQQTLPLPRLSTSVAYYKRKLWVYNLCIHDLKKNESKFYLWDETNGGRGSAEIASCLDKWIEAEYREADFSTLKVVSDNCSGQNKNLNIILFYLREIHSKRLQSITHNYLVPGHSYMACDRAFGNIEKHIRKVGCIYDFQGYVKAITLSVVSMYKVIAMRHTDFLNFDLLQKQVTVRKPKAPFSFQDARSFELRLKYPEGYFVNMSYSGGNWGAVRLQKGKNRWRRDLFDLSSAPLPVKYPTYRALQPGKTEHLKQLLAYIPHQFTRYLEYIIRQQSNLQHQHDTSEDDEENLHYDIDEEVVDDPQLMPADDADDPQPMEDDEDDPQLLA